MKDVDCKCNKKFACVVKVAENIVGMSVIRMLVNRLYEGSVLVLEQDNFMLKFVWNTIC